jgi:hypothetical protein
MNTRRNPGLFALLALLLAACTSCGGNDPDPGDGGGGDASSDAAACVAGDPCDDGDPCTVDDAWDTDCACAGTPKVCGEELACATMVCDPADGACVETGIAAGTCLIDGACFDDGAPNPGNDCEICVAGVAQDAWGHAEYGAPCEDGNPCTEADTCDTGVCFAGTPPSCADGIQCTVDTCDPEEGCSHELHHGDCADDNPCTEDLCDPDAGGCTNVPDDEKICSDLDVCTLNDRCEDGACISDPAPLPCDDENACTDEICHPVFGCVYTFNEDPCDDGASCTQDDVCHWGVCLGEEPWTNTCPPCDITFSEHVQKLTKIAVGTGGWQGEALNIDGDLKTCSPSGSCENGLDNALSFAGEFINDTIQQNIVAEENTLSFTVELIDPSWEGEPFTMKLYYSGLSPMNPDCDFMAETCIYQAGSINFDALCNVQITFDNTVFEDGKLTAGGSGYIFPFQMSFAGGSQAELVLYSSRVEGTLNFAEDGTINSMTGVFGGAVTKEDITSLVEAINAAYFPGGQDTKDMLLGLIPMMNNDIDLDGDGTTDGVSIGMIFDSIPGIMAPYYY